MPKLSPDKQWESFNRKLQKFMQTNDWIGLGVTYYQMANFLKGEGKDSSQLRQQGYKVKLRRVEEELKRYDKQRIKRVEILAISESCKNCKKMNGKVFSIKRAIESKPLPVESCEHEYGCRCGYLPVID